MSYEAEVTHWAIEHCGVNEHRIHSSNHLKPFCYAVSLISTQTEIIRKLKQSYINRRTANRLLGIHSVEANLLWAKLFPSQKQAVNKIKEQNAG